MAARSRIDNQRSLIISKLQFFIIFPKLLQFLLSSALRPAVLSRHCLSNIRSNQLNSCVLHKGNSCSSEQHILNCDWHPVLNNVVNFRLRD